MYHLVRVIDLKSLQFFKSSLFIKFKGWLWKMLVFEFIQSKGYPFTKNPSFLIILIKIRQYPWDFIFEKIHDFQRIVLEIVKMFPNLYLILSFTFFMIFIQISHFLNESQRKNRFKRRLKWNFSSILKSLFKIKFKIRISLKNSFYGHKRDKNLLETWNPFQKIVFFNFFRIFPLN